MNMGTKQQKAKEYVNGLWNDGLIDSSEDFDKIWDGYEKGWDEALKSQWIRADEQLPDFDDVGNISEKRKYFVRIMYVGTENEIGYTVAYMRSRYKFSAETDRVKVTHWMPIPTFDDILNANKDVLKRLKGE